MAGMNEIYRSKAHKYIPSGAHTYSRTDEVFPSNAPAIIDHSKGVYTWDLEGNRYLDYAMACRSVTIGYDFDEITNAAIEQIRKGNTSSKASKIEVEAAEAMIDLIPWIDMVKFAKNGSTVTTAAVKLARAYTGKKYVVRCYEHSFFSYDDWFIGDTEVKCGIPSDIYNLTLHFHYNEIESLKAIFEEYPDEIACVIMEPVESEKPQEGFLQGVRDLCDKNGVIFIIDEMITGFRWNLQGACKYYDIKPDLVTYGKGMANGFSVAALGGKREIMELGGNIPGKERVFLISTTHGAEMGGLGALVATIEAYKKYNVTDHMWKMGKRLCDGIEEITSELHMEKYFLVRGEECSPFFVVCDKSERPSLEYRTIFCQEMLRQKVLMPYISLAYQHTEKEIDYTLDAIRHAICVLSDALNDKPERFLQGNIIKPVFRKVN